MAGEDTFDLAALSHAERQEAYQRCFSTTTQPLGELDIQLDDATYPEFAEEVFDAYLTHTEFTVGVWVNYDCAAKRFYDDRRTLDCGKLILTPNEHRQLRQLEPEKYEISRVCLNIGTAFRLLCEVHLQAVQGKLNTGCVVNGKLRAHTREHGHLINYVNDVLDEIIDEPLEHGFNGFQLQDLEEIAARFLRFATEDDQQLTVHSP